MRYLINAVIVIVTTALTFVGCEKSDNTYKGAEYIGFSDTTALCPVFEDGREFEIAVASTTVADYDRVLGVEIIDSSSTAIEGLHYKLSTTSVTIKAGESRSTIKMHGIYDNFESTDSVGVQLRLVTKKDVKWELYPQSQDIKVSFAKVCPFDINAFSGYAIASSTFLYDINNGETRRLVYTSVDPSQENTIIIKDWFVDGDAFRDNYDIRLSFNTDDPLAPYLEMEDGQIVANTRQVLGRPLGDHRRSQQSQETASKPHLE